MRIPLLIGKKAGGAGVPALSVERLVNGYVEQSTDSKEFDPVFGTPGLIAWATGMNGKVRGQIEMAGVEYAVAGVALYRINAAGLPTQLGTVPGADDVSMAHDGTNLVIVAGGEIYIWNGTTFGPVIDEDAPAASSVVWTDGFFVFGELDTQQFFVSALADPTDYDALDFASAEWKPDRLLTPFLVKNTLFMGGEKTIEAQQNVGGADFPFARYQDVFIDVGLIGRQAVTVTNDTAFWIAHDKTVRRLDGLTATKISTAGIAELIEGWADPSLTVASNHVWGDHLFIVFRNPDGCIVFDQANNRWHERRSYDQPSWRVAQFNECYGYKLFGSATEGTIYRLDAEAYDEAGAILPFEMVTPYAYAMGQRLTISQLEVIVQAGVGSLTLNPQIGLERTVDGETWGARAFRRLGKVGERVSRVVFGPQGQSRGSAFRLTITDPVQRAVLGIYIEAEGE